MTDAELDRLLTPTQVAEIFNVTPRTVQRWATVGALVPVMTPGGRRRFRESQVRAYLNNGDN